MSSSAALPAALAVCLLAFVLFAPALVGGKVLSPSASINLAPPFAAHRPASLTRAPNRALNDNTTLFENHLSIARAAISAGRLPLWDPFVGAGRPLGAGQGAPLFPISWLAYVLPFWHAFGWMALAKLLLAGIGIALFCGSLGLGRAPCVLAAVALPFCNLFVAFLGHGQADAFALAPWSLLAAERIARGGGLRWALALGLLLGLGLYNGHPESFLLMALLAYGYLILRAITLPQSSDRVGYARRTALMLGASALIGAAIGAFALISLLDVVDEGLRLSRAGAAHASLRDMLIGAALPEFWGRPDKLVLGAYAPNVFSAYFNGHVYIGALPLLLAATGFARRPRPQQWFFAAVAALSLLAVLAGPVQDLLGSLPLLSLENPFEYMWPLTVAVVLLAAFGAEALLSGDRRLLRRQLAILAGSVVVVLALVLTQRPHLLGAVGAGLGDVPSLRGAESSANAAAAGGLLRFLLLAGAAAALLVVAGRHTRHRQWLAVGLVAVTALDLVLIDRGWWPMSSRALVAPPATGSLRAVRGSGPQWRVAGLGVSFTPDLAERYGVMDMRVIDLPEISRYSRLFSALGGDVLPAYGQTALLSIGPQQLKLLDLFATRWLLDGGPPAPVPAGLRVVSATAGDRLLENVHAFPRAWLAFGSTPATGADGALRAIVASPARSLYLAPVIEGAPAAAAAQPPAPVSFEPSSSTHLTLRYDSARAGWLVLADTYFPGWRATIDGRRTQIYAANGAFRAVHAPAGTHRVQFSFDPAGEVGAAVLSSISLIAVVIALALGAAISSGISRGSQAAAGGLGPDARQHQA